MTCRIALGILSQYWPELNGFISLGSEINLSNSFFTKPKLETYCNFVIVDRKSFLATISLRCTHSLIVPIRVSNEEFQRQYT